MKTVEEQQEHLVEMKREPQLGYDTFTSQITVKESDDVYLSRMYYLYHFQDEDAVHPSQVPPQICPIAIISFSQQRPPRNPGLSR